MAHICPSWFVFTFDNRWRGRVHPPARVLEPYVREGMRALDVGCGAGFNTEALAQIVGRKGSVVSVDIQSKMLDKTRARLERKGLLDRVELVQASADSLGLASGRFDFVLAFWMVHEVRDKAGLLTQLREVVKPPPACLLLVEPKIHVPRRAFERTVETALSMGFVLRDRPRVAFSRAVCLLREPVCRTGRGEERGRGRRAGVSFVREPPDSRG